MVHVIDRRRAWALDSPDGRDLLHALAPAPNKAVGLQDWDGAQDVYTRHMLDPVTARLPDLGGDPEIDDAVSP